jgi:hypothetical protein
MPFAASAFVVANDSSSDTGGQVSSGQVSVTGNSDADSEVHTDMNSEGGIQTVIHDESDGSVHTQVINTAIPQKSPKIEVHSTATSTAHIGFFTSFWAHIKLFFHFF